ncbi:facilitated trehalose transporter Tret1-2 homolog [Episyrphus balteatus]|uniref:facilitated trehalose transporter Tret1-2 homolog n=1 Tax=Episyrphus balteatus TaxID=286459 RepID=UPI00248535C0|nr:facilitated trehalose transporter Tret1-2 homolog [Episyrphus balteatus]
MKKHYNMELEALQKSGPKPSIPLGEQNKAILRQEFMVFLMNVGLFAGGIALALPAVTLNQLTNPAEDVYLDKNQASWFASCSQLACPLGGILCALMVDKYGRKNTTIVTNIIAVLAWALMAFPMKGRGSNFVFLQLIASRVMSGIVKGMGGTATACYGTEICLPRIRARLIMAVTMAMASGVLFIYILGYFIRDNWRLLGMVLLGYQIICLICLIPVKESPVWLMSKGRTEEAKDSLSFFRGLRSGETHKEVEAEFIEMTKNAEMEIDKAKTSFWEFLTRPEFYKPLMLSIVFYILQQFAGTFIVLVYAVQILTNSGLHIDPYLYAIYMGIARFVVASFIMTWELETWTRRQVGIFSAISMSFCMFLLAASNWCPWLQMSYLPVAVVIGVVIFGAGLWAVPFVVCMEIFPQNIRGPCSGLTDGFVYFMSFVTIKLFPTMVDEMGSGNTFMFYGITAIVTAVFIYMCIPETKGKTLHEIEEYFSSKRKKEPKMEEMTELVVKIKP